MKRACPSKKGLSSSAAWCVTVVRAFNQLFDLHLSVRGEMNAAYTGERHTASKCGRLDQCCAFGSNLVQVTFDGDRLATEPIVLPCKLYLVIVDLKRSKDTPRILTDLQQAYPVARTGVHRGVQALLGPINQAIVNVAMIAAKGEASDSEINELERRLKRMASDMLNDDADDNEEHNEVEVASMTVTPSPPVSSSSSSSLSASLLSTSFSQQHPSPSLLSSASPSDRPPSHLDNDDLLSPISSSSSSSSCSSESMSVRIPRQLGRLMCLAQRWFDRLAQPASPQQLSAPFLHQVLSHASIASLIYGGKGVGSQGDGSAQFVACDEVSQTKVCEILERELHVDCLKLTFG